MRYFNSCLSLIVAAVLIVFLLPFFASCSQQNKGDNSIRESAQVKGPKILKDEVGNVTYNIPDSSFQRYWLCSSNSLNELKDGLREFKNIFMDSGTVLKWRIYARGRYFIVSVPTEIKFGGAYNLFTCNPQSKALNKYFGISICKNNPDFSHYSVYIGDEEMNDFIFNKYKLGDEFGVYLPDASWSPVSKCLKVFKGKYLPKSYSAFLIEHGISEGILDSLSYARPMEEVIFRK